MELNWSPEGAGDAAQRLYIAYQILDKNAKGAYFYFSNERIPMKISCRSDIMEFKFVALAINFPSCSLYRYSDDCTKTTFLLIIDVIVE